MATVLAPPVISDGAFEAFRAWLHAVAGIRLSEQKRALVVGRLAGRLRHYRLASYEQYFELVTAGAHPAEPQVALDLLTTNETQFFREPKHFDFLAACLQGASASRPLRAWSAASSSGEEPYSIAMTLAAGRGEAPWEVVASDVSQRMLERAQTGHYAMARAKSIPPDFLRRYCLRGVGGQQGTFLVDPRIRSRVSFLQVNLNQPLPELGEFDVIFLRNVMIYFDNDTKRRVVERVVRLLRPGGHLLVGHSESLNGVSEAVKPLRPSIYRKQP